MLTYSITVYLVGAFLTLYGLRSLVAGIKNEKKAYWINFGYSSGLKKLLKENYNKANNLWWGCISFLCGILILVGY